MPISEYPGPSRDSGTPTPMRKHVITATLWVVALISVPILARQSEYTSATSIVVASVLGACVIWGLLRI